MRSKQMTTLCLLRVIVIVVWVLAAAYGAPYLYIYDIVKVSTFLYMHTPLYYAWPLYKFPNI